ncbi:M23 family metallopeptidase [Gammaproteobacteria bacterium]|nr:M23 family metallopeptidase [Gammaproteobacteria bacterium]MDC0512394.1 M23 family metallopeptidase [Gammaproteobacteria bacterium]MDC0918654.1 peptidoglycan DD-metalloendopeptidase family protein [Gammaproteobacteria bacterium]
MSTYKPNTKILPFILLAVFGVLLIYDAGVEQEEVPSEIITETLSLPTQSIPSIQTKKIHTVKDGENLSLIFEQYKVPLNETYKIFKKDIANEVKNILPNDRIEFLSLDGKLQKIIIHKSPLLSYQVQVLPEIVINRAEKEPELIQSFRSGLIESSFYLAGLKNDIPESVIMDLAYIFAWDIDFVFDIRVGDKFKLLYETPFVDGQQIENGSILFAEFYNQSNRFTAIRYKGKNKEWEYFNENGGSLEKAFLRAPLDFAYVSSHFNPNRRHPILNTIRAHNGVDYAAKRGTPIRATGEGVIQSVGWKSGYGRTIVIRHGGEITTLYAHLDKYHPLIVKGAKVSQGQTIGYVGDSGLATAPHLHYEFRIGEKRTDPLKVALPSASPLDKSNMDQFQSFRNNYIEIADQLLSKDPNENLFR